ncbi:hypothetical protein NP233_g5032 [Leucocoprinus birnbaumii]|uniref:Uncharacterized protein n=1 Tax=Leucocoprinus birnbaumii TaxID=56174 RepID=A0AAD5YRB2_9AGAR|nr:hypothetical protein NP233_g5032 [Leucocoprinus birnbaumii]
MSSLPHSHPLGVHPANAITDPTFCQLNKHPTAIYDGLVRITYYYEAGKCPKQFWTPLAQNWLFYKNNFEFECWTDFSGTRIEIFNPETIGFAAIMRKSALRVMMPKYPWLIMRKAGLKDVDCPNLFMEISALFDTMERIARSQEVTAAANQNESIAERNTGEGAADGMPCLSDFIEDDEHVMTMSDANYVEGEEQTSESDTEFMGRGDTASIGESAPEMEDEGHNETSLEDEVEHAVLPAHNIATAAIPAPVGVVAVAPVIHSFINGAFVEVIDLTYLKCFELG